MHADLVLIVGARGFIGSHVVRRLLTVGRPVHIFGPAMADDLLADLAGRFSETHASIEDASALDEVLARSQARSVIFLASFGQGRMGLAASGEAAPDRAIAVNVLGFRNLLEAARRAQVRRVVWASSTVVYGPAELYGGAPVDEEARRRPRTAYGLTKAQAEQLATYYRDRHGMDVCGVRIPLIVGPGRWYVGAADALMRLFAGATPGASPEIEAPAGRVDLMYAADAADIFVVLEAFDGPLSDRYNVNGFAASHAEIAEALRRRVPGYTPRLVERPAAFAYPLIDTARIEREVGWRPAFDLERTVDEYLKVLKGGRA
jgi:UDP-glucose 4-epimerase